MMATTHAFAGLLLAVVVAILVPEFAAVVAVTAILGGFFPDLDLPGTHRKTLHFPVYYWALAVPAALVAVVVPTQWTVGLAVFLLAAAVHSVSDVLGGGLEPRPWQGTSDRAVYSHYHGRWLPPRRWVGYDGSPGDLALAAVLALPALVVFEGAIRTVVIAMLGVSIGYATVRKPLVTVGERLVDRAPPGIVTTLPDWVLPDLDGHEHDHDHDRDRDHGDGYGDNDGYDYEPEHDRDQNHDRTHEPATATLEDADE